MLAVSLRDRRPQIDTTMAQGDCRGARAPGGQSVFEECAANDQQGAVVSDDEAASWAAMAFQDNPDFQAGVRISAASNAMVGWPEGAHETVVRLQRLNSTLRVLNLKHVLGPYRRAEDLARYEEGLRKAGLPRMTSQPACPTRRQVKVGLPLM
jgi:hypothetical protein